MADGKDSDGLRQNRQDLRLIDNPDQSIREDNVNVEGDLNFISLNGRRNNLPINPNPVENVSEPISLVVNRPKVVNNQDVNRVNSDKVNYNSVDNNGRLHQQDHRNGLISKRPHEYNRPPTSYKAETVGTKRGNYDNQGTSDLVSSTTLGVTVRNLKRRVNDNESCPSHLVNSHDHSLSLSPSAVSSSTSCKRRSVEITRRHNRKDDPDMDGFLRPKTPDDGNDNWRGNPDYALRRSFSLEALLTQRPSVIQRRVYMNKGPAHVIANQANRLSDDPNESQIINNLVRRYSAPIERCSTESEAMPPVTSTTPL